MTVSTKIKHMSMWGARLVSAGVVVVLTTGSLVAIAYADVPLQSPHYEFTEDTVGSNGMLQTGSPNYQISLSAGDAAIGNTASTNYQIEAGSKTTANPALTVIINNGAASFGLFSATGTATATSTFSVVDYTSYGYSVFIDGNAPSNNGNIITPMAATAAPTPGSNQFGINLVANTSPTAFGALPVQKPDSSFGSGTVDSTTCSKITAGYNTPNQFKYVSGDSIAASCKSSGETDYTISYIVDISSMMPGGQYTGNQSIICVATY